MSDSAAKKRLGDIVVERKLITSQQLDEALAVQRANGGKLGEILVDLGFLTRVALAGVIAEQWDSMRLTQGGQKAAVAPVAPAGSPAEAALRERVDALTAELAARDQRIAQLDATISALLGQLGQNAAA
jgi:3-deoxy-D-manno-octulosonate 8-phosphate phosphatase KdsC-like HAD superfamily phosphatase